MKVVETKTVALAEILVGEYEVRGAQDDPELPALAESIRREGLLQALGVVQRDDGLHLVHGHRRYSACILARLSHVRVDVLEGDNATMERASIIENYHRKDVTPMERATQISKAVDSGAMSVEELAGTFHRSIDWVHEQMAMLTWPLDVQELVHQRVLSPSAAKHLAKVSDDTYRAFLLGHAVDGGCSERTALSYLMGFQQQVPAEAVVLTPPAESQGPPRPVLPKSLCMGCHDAFPPDGMAIAYLCPGCVVNLQTGGRIVPK